MREGPTPPNPVYAPQPRTNTLAVISLVFGVLWIFWVGSLIAVVSGHMARSEIAKSNGAQSGDGLAAVGLVLGWIGIGPVLFLVVVVTLL